MLSLFQICLKIYNSVLPFDMEDCFDVNKIPLSENETLRIAQEKILSGKTISELSIGEQLHFRDKITRLDSQTAYRAVNFSGLQSYAETGFILGQGKDDEFILGENNKGIDWFLGGYADRYGQYVIAAPALKEYFMLTHDNGNGLSGDPFIRHIKSSGYKNPIPSDLCQCFKLEKLQGDDGQITTRIATQAMPIKTMVELELKRMQEESQNKEM